MKTYRINYSRATRIGPLSGMEDDPLLTPVHISLYAALLHFSQIQTSNPFNVNRRELMGASKIRSTATYHRCIKLLVDSGYIFYEPSYHPVKGSKVFLIEKNEKTVADGEDRKILIDLVC